jgi:NADPH:quinone reductase-like Zn-dependent oxidoreductase
VLTGDAVAKTVYDCHVTAICSERNVKYVTSLGADKVIDYTKEDVASRLRLHRTEAKKDYDLLVDCVGGTDLLPFYASRYYSS